MWIERADRLEVYEYPDGGVGAVGVDSHQRETGGIFTGSMHALGAEVGARISEKPLFLCVKFAGGITNGAIDRFYQGLDGKGSASKGKSK